MNAERRVKETFQNIEKRVILKIFSSKVPAVNEIVTGASGKTGVALIYKDIIDGEKPEDLNYLDPKKTLLASFAALEKYSGMRIEDLHKDGLLIPVVYMYWALACGWDDCMDNEGKQPKDALEKTDGNGMNPQKIWDRGIRMIKANPNIKNGIKTLLIGDLERAKAEYIKKEADLKKPGLFEGKNPEEVLRMVMCMREGSFGNIARVMTRVFTRGERNTDLEDIMARVTLAFGIIDGFMDINEDEENETMTEARALLAVHGNKKDAISRGVRIVKELVG